MNKKIKKVLSIFMSINMSITLLFTSKVSSFAQSYIMNWHLVDSGKHLDYNGNSIYMSNVKIGIDIWNGYKSGVIRKDTAYTIEDVYISDIWEVSGAAGHTYKNGKIELNEYNLRNSTYPERTNTATHELGHALGLDHSPSSSDIMGPVQSSSNTLSKNDKDSYDASYKRY